MYVIKDLVPDMTNFYDQCAAPRLPADSAPSVCLPSDRTVSRARKDAELRVAVVGIILA